MGSVQFDEIVFFLLNGLFDIPFYTCNTVLLNSLYFSSYVNKKEQVMPQVVFKFGMLLEATALLLEVNIFSQADHAAFVQVVFLVILDF